MCRTLVVCAIRCGPVSTLFWTIAILAAYLAGAIPFGLLIGRLHGIDIRQHGSKNIGATNVGRVLGRGAGMLCFVLDMLKGAVPVLLAGWFAGTYHVAIEELTQQQMLLWLAVVIAPVLGHMFSPFIGFSGGKGVATGFGAMFAMWPVLTFPVLGALITWYATLRLTKYMSLASILGAVSVPVFLVLWLIPADVRDIGPALWHAWPPLVLTTLLAALVVYKHRTNISRLLSGEEPKIGRQVIAKDAERHNDPQ